MIDDIGMIDNDLVAMARYHANHRELVSLNDWKVARRTTSGHNLRDFLLRCAYWWCCSKDLTITDFSNECEISLSTAIAFDKRMRSIYPETAGLSLGGGKGVRYQISSLTDSVLEAILNESDSI